MEMFQPWCTSSDKFEWTKRIDIRWFDQIILEAFYLEI